MPTYSEIIAMPCTRTVIALKAPNPFNRGLSQNDIDRASVVTTANLNPIPRVMPGHMFSSPVQSSSIQGHIDALNPIEEHKDFNVHRRAVPKEAYNARNDRFERMGDTETR
jgi:hypothetical protein